VHVGRKVQYCETVAGVVVSQAMNSNGAVIMLKDRKLFWVDGKTESCSLWHFPGTCNSTGDRRAQMRKTGHLAYLKHMSS